MFDVYPCESELKDQWQQLVHRSFVSAIASKSVFVTVKGQTVGIAEATYMAQEGISGNVDVDRACIAIFLAASKNLVMVRLSKTAIEEKVLLLRISAAPGSHR